MKLFKYIFWLAGAGLILTGCQKELEKINRNPNESETVQPDYLLTNGIKTNVDTYWGNDAAFETSLLYVQYWAKIQYTDPDRYIPAATSIQTVWNNFYAQGVEDFTTLAALGDSLNNPNYKAVAIIMRSWIFQVLTDLYGDVPYKQTADIEKYLTPQYDNQRDIYLGLLAELKTAAGLINTSADGIAGDILLRGDLLKWKKFANSLRLRIALRIADQEFDAAKAVFDEIGADNSNLIASNDENVKLNYLASPNQNPVAKNRETRNDYRISKSVVDKLNALNDPRLTIYAAMPRDTNKIIGVTNGLPTDSASRLGFNKTSDVGAVFTAASAPAVLFSYAELLFIKAEAAQRGLLAGEDAATLYAAAVTASLKQYGVSDAAVATYLLQPSVVYNAANYKQSIGDQKWLALFGDGLAGFAEWRRLDYPKLPAAYTGVLGGKSPLRLTYPSSEQALNGVNYKAAVAHQGADQLITRLWFDKE
ncbi:SusD/RagB family nutrient-binding outer membrane lipoprotein [Chitinophaga tropicalis]|uniref:SusD/RagB family nutrient-binding outer membrane lipoprotein n=1 Tax=Chitinophaga tropicalis TaxID=2683588 RepID=A0A7K1UA13_9BACT|nr:SusD/RagB family nutrient-binding outer membrane lipoprotein [Chitinophaga tropicalis]MVT11120.1 SusD/RagB family nutrient-binding outer membrane lipoprotein [Chitinophaga tropicalis]